jgi:uncharacterized protein
LDTSVLIPSLVDEPTSAAVDAFISAGGHQLFVSDFAVVEVAATLSRFVRTRSFDAAAASARLTEFDAWRAGTATAVDVRSSDVRLAYTYVRRFELMLRAPDALHLAMTQRLGATFVTLDRPLIRAAAALGIAVAEPR